MTILSFLSQTGVHEKHLRKFFDGRVVYDGPPVYDHPLYCIGFFNRSGSNLLAGYLRATPYFAGFHEQLNFDTVQNQAANFGAESFPDFLRAATDERAAGRFVYGFKASADQLMMLQRFGIPKMYAGGLRIIHILREDLIGQAVSYQIASQTQKWTSRQAGVGDAAEVTFNAKQITHLISAALESNNAIAAFADIFGHPRLQVGYEDLVADPRREIDRIAAFAGRGEARWPIKPPAIEQQASEINDRFRDQYRAHAVKALL